MSTTRPVVVLIYQRLSLPWVFESATRAGLELVLVPRPDESVDPYRLPPAVREVLPLNIEADPDAALSVLRERYAASPFDGVMTLYDPLVPFVADVAEALGLNGIGSATARAVQDKRLMRQRLCDAGLNVPRFVTLDDPSQWELALHLSFPAVVKPAGGYSSLGVTKVDRAEDLKPTVAQVGDICRDKLGGAMGLVVEEFLDGPEIAVESLAYEGAVTVLSVGDKGEPVGPHFEEGIYRAPAALPDDVLAAIVDEVTKAHAALGVSTGPTHTELRLRSGRTPHLLELGARIGGSGVSHYITQHVTGVDLAAEALRIAAGLAPQLATSADTVQPTGVCAANYIVPTGGSGRITSISGLEELSDDDRVDHVIQMLHPGDVVRPYPDFTGYPAFVLSHHDSDADARDFHRSLETSIRVGYEQE